MIKFILKRIFEAIPTLLVLITVSFFLMRFAPGNPFSSERPLPPEVMANIEAKYGLDKPVFEQYTTYLTNIIQGDFGPSFKYQDYTVNELISVALPVSAKVGLIAFIFTVIMGVTVGTIAALKQNTWVDYTIMSTAMLGVVMPSFVLAPALIYLFHCTGICSQRVVGTMAALSICSFLLSACRYFTWQLSRVSRVVA
ncbi:oligopeptide transport system permease protein OppB [Vibrio variabilis]|uniref:Oligopeptide transport system permease protein OppB n=1 Tax=Vibrio variabilis TaxID=990271 RepID=A0ABQ0JHQ3_9VIBR|nr:oligopeptide transport system permease protein OppB [Vibrio variabilis]